MSTAVQNPTRPLVVMPRDHHGKEIELDRRTVYMEFSLHALGTSRKVPESLWSDLGIVGPGDEAEDADEKLDKALIKVSKELFDSATLAEIKTFDGHTRAWLRNKCLPFQRGVHFLSYGLVELVEREFKRRRVQRRTLIDKFLEEYPRLCRDIAKRLTKKYYNPADYPTLEEVASSFRMTWRFFKFGVPEELALVSPEVFEAARKDASARLKQAAAHIEEIMTAEALNLVSKLRDALTPGADGRKRKLCDAHFTNLADFLAFFDHRNVTNNTDLKQIVDDLRNKLGDTDIQEIRKTKELREQLGTEMSAITEQLTNMVERVPRRKITLH
jgi:hypothetical protein